MPKFQIEIWYHGLPTNTKLAAVIVEAESELKALKRAEKLTSHWVIGEIPEMSRRSKKAKK